MSKKSTIFDRLNALIQDTEFSLVNFISSIAPWLAPVAPASMTFSNTQTRLGFTFPVALATAIVVEVLGISAISTAMLFYGHNRRYKSDKNQVSLAVPVIAAVSYILIVLSVNVLLETDWQYAGIVSRALLTLLSVPAALILAVRAQFTLTVNRIASEHAPMHSNAVHDAPDAVHICALCGEACTSHAQYAAHMRWKHAPSNGKVVSKKEKVSG